LRKRLATFFVVLYAFCVLAPHLTMAAVQTGNLIHCLTQSETSYHQHAAKSHMHAEGVAHQHDHAGSIPAGDDKGMQTACCGLFSVPGLAADLRHGLDRERHGGEKIVARLEDALADHPPGSLIRPPIA
jgi:hypothetical protein